ncbi:MAG: hypothetical protein ACREDL_15570 [Bradyrhizobium sp.]
MRRSTKTLLRGFVKDTFRRIGVDVRGYIPNRPNGPAPGRAPALPTNVLDLPVTSGGWLPHRAAPFVLAATNPKPDTGTCIPTSNQSRMDCADIPCGWAGQRPHLSERSCDLT